MRPSVVPPLSLQSRLGVDVIVGCKPVPFLQGAPLQCLLLERHKLAGFWLNFGATLAPCAESVTVDGEQVVIPRVVARSGRFYVTEHDLVREGLGRGGGRKERGRLSRMRDSLAIST